MGVVSALFLLVCIAGRTKTASIHLRGLKTAGEGHGPQRPFTPPSPGHNLRLQANSSPTVTTEQKIRPQNIQGLELLFLTPANENDYKLVTVPSGFPSAAAAEDVLRENSSNCQQQFLEDNSAAEPCEELATAEAEAEWDPELQHQRRAAKTGKMGLDPSHASLRFQRINGSLGPVAIHQQACCFIP